MRNSKFQPAFGKFIREKRLEKGISLRKLAKELDVSASYLSQIELGFLLPPSEKVIVVLASLLDQNCDELLARAGKISSNLRDIIISNPKLCSKLLHEIDLQGAKKFIS
jgi:transcriptional regulator with XRE-family HTH domain